MVKKIVVIAGGFDPIHGGHIDHIRQAKALGDWLIVITHPDDVLERKKGYCLTPLKDRIAILTALRAVDEVIVSLDGDGTVARTLEWLYVALLEDFIFAKGGDRTPDNMPENEVKVCQKNNIEIVYGKGAVLNSSQDLVRKVLNKAKVIDNFIHREI